MVLIEGDEVESMLVGVVGGRLIYPNVRHRFVYTHGVVCLLKTLAAENFDADRWFIVKAVDVWCF